MTAPEVDVQPVRSLRHLDDHECRQNSGTNSMSRLERIRVAEWSLMLLRMKWFALGAFGLAVGAAGIGCGSDSRTEGELPRGTGAGSDAAVMSPGLIADSGASTSTAGGPVGGNGASPMLQPISLDECGADNPAKLSAADVQKLKAGGASTGMRTLYPYDGTVFPRGLTAPVLMWEGGTAKAVYVHMKAGLFEYHGCLVPSATGQLQVPQKVWDTAGQQTRGASDPFLVELSTWNGSAAAGPLSLKLTIAQATLKGSIYYNSYNSQLSGSFGQNGSILRIKPGKSAEVFLRQNTCTGCHSVSANGQRIIAKELGASGGGFSIPGLGGVGADGQIYALTPTTAPNPQPLRGAQGASFTGLSPNGKFYVSSAASLNVGPPLQGGVLAVAANATLYETDTGNAVQGSGIPTSAMMPTFSPDGTLITFSDSAAGGHSLSVMTFDVSGGKASSKRDVFTDASKLAGWPFVLPDNSALVFTLGTSSQFTGGGAGINPVAQGPESDLALVDLRTGKSFVLAQAMGFRTQADLVAGKTYLPFGAAELHRHYYPTVSPVSGGGYFWIFFDTIRHYGNQGLHRQLWGAAVAVQSAASELGSTSYEKDPSFPAFYLAGQELPVANHRAFTVLDPCRADGQTCETGVDCCSGFCTNGKCGVEAPRCAMTNEACKVSADCCSKQDSCINGFCAPPLLL